MRTNLQLLTVVLLLDVTATYLFYKPNLPKYAKDTIKDPVKLYTRNNSQMNINCQMFERSLA